VKALDAHGDVIGTSNVTAVSSSHMVVLTR